MGRLQPVVLHGLQRLCRLYWEYDLEDFYITGMEEGEANPGSLKFAGYGFSFKRQGMQRKYIKRVLGKDWVVSIEENQCTVEYYPWKAKMDYDFFDIPGHVETDQDGETA